MCWWYKILGGKKKSRKHLAKIISMILTELALFLMMGGSLFEHQTQELSWWWDGKPRTRRVLKKLAREWNSILAMWEWTSMNDNDTFRQYIVDFYKQIEDALKLGSEIRLSKNCDTIVHTAVGGSSFPGAVLKKCSRWWERSHFKQKLFYSCQL